MRSHLLLLLLLGLVYSSQAINSTAEIFDLLEAAVKSKGAEQCNRLLQKHYFTEDKSNAIWVFALEDANTLLRRTFDKRDFITWEKDIRKIKFMFNDCINGNKDRADCEEIFPIIHQSMKHFQWPSLGAEFFRTTFISVRMAFQSMILLMFSSMMKEPWVESFKDVREWFPTIENEYLESSKYFTRFAEVLEEERPYDITVPEVCEYRRYLWKDFEQPGCEKRWKKNEKAKETKKSRRSAEDEDKDDNKDNDDEDDEEEEDGKEEESEFFKTFANPDENSVYSLGGVSSEYDLIVKAKFTDFGGKKKIITGAKEYSTRVTSKGEVIEELINDAYDRRSIYTKDKLKEMSAYLNATFGKLQPAEKVFKKQLKALQKKWEQKDMSV